MTTPQVQGRNVMGVTVASSSMEHAATEIYNSYGDEVVVRRKSLHKFGANQSIGTATEDINWDGIEPLHSTTNSITVASSSDAGDTTQTVRVEGMYFDENDDFIFSAQDVALNGQNQVTLSQPLCRVTRIANVASATATAGDVYVYESGTATNGVPDDLDTVGNIMPLEHQSTMFAGTSVSSTNYFILTSMQAGGSLSGTKDTYVDILLEVRDKDSVYRTVNIFTVNTSNGATQIHFDTPIIIPPNSDIDMTAASLAAGASITAGFNGYFADIV